MDMLWSIDSCQKRVSADQCHLTVSHAQVYGSMNVISMHHYCLFSRIPTNSPRSLAKVDLAQFPSGNLYDLMV